MPLITYKFADGHTEEIEVTDEVAAAFEQLEKYEKKVERKETRRHISYDKLLDSGFEFPDEKKQEIFSLLTYRQADAYFRHKYLHLKKTEIAKGMNVTEGAVRNLLKKRKPTCKSINWRTIKRSSC